MAVWSPSVMTVAFGLFLVFNSAASQGTCHLNSTWKGMWFQSGLPSIRIDEGSIETKGKCVNNDGDYYLFEDQEEKCYRCLFIASKHLNVLQYKESYCEDREKPNESYADLKERVCAQINGDASQYSLFRRDAAPVECPFKGSYTFTYSRGHGECRSPISRLDSCTENWRTFFRYQACPDVQGTESSEEQLECLAGWKDGSLHYMMGRVQHVGATSDEDRYRCFVYEKIQAGSNSAGSAISPSSSGTTDRHRLTILLAQSGDATCSGLTSPTEGSRTMKLTKVEADGRGRGCRFPPWFLAHSHWQTLDGRWTYNLHKNSTLRITNITHGPPSTSAPKSTSNSFSGVDSRQEQKAVCHSVLDHLGSNNRTYRVVAHLSQGCQTGYVCMVFYQRDAHIVEFQAGESAPSPEEACSTYYFNPVPGHYTTLIASDRGSHQTVSCPLDGKFSVVPSSSASARLPCSSVDLPLMDIDSVPHEHTMNHFITTGHRTSTIAVGCSAPDTLDLYHECSRNPSSGYLCRSAWSDDYDPHTKFVIVTPLHSLAVGGGASRQHEPQKRYCLTLSSSHNTPAKALSMTSSPQQQTQQQQVLAVTSGPSPAPVVATGLLSQWEWIASSETCVRPYARDRFATHGLHSTHLTHNPHNLHITSSSSGGASVVNVTWAGVNGQCTGMEAAITDSRKLLRSSSTPLDPFMLSCWWILLANILFSLKGR